MGNSITALLAAGLLVFASGSAAEAREPGADTLAKAPGAGTEAEVRAKRLQQNCELLDDPSARLLMEGAMETRLLIACNRRHELGAVKSDMQANEAQRPLGEDTVVSDSTGETGPTTTQSETSIAINEDTGTLCSGFNDAFSGVQQNLGFTGFARSDDGGNSFVDKGALNPDSFGDPSMVWRRADGHFYLATLHSSGGLAMHQSTDDCESFQFIGLAHSGFSDDKELIAVDNNPSSDFFGRIYMAWTDFGAGGRIFGNHSDDGINWTPAIALSTATDVQGAWPTTAPNGDVYVSWVRWKPFFSGPMDIEMVRSTDGGVSYSFVTNPLTDAVNPFASGPTNQCGRPALNGQIRYLPSPQVVVSPNGDVHVVYTYDQDGRDVGDVVDVFYRRSSDNGTTWSPEFQLNDDGTLNDQFFPTISVGPSGRLMSTWYDRRLDPNNQLIDYYARVSEDGGDTWLPSERVSDESSPVYLDPNLASCYHGDYDMQIQTAASGVIQWSDDREVNSGHPDPDVWVDRNLFQPDFVISPQITSREVCGPTPAIYPIEVTSVLDFSDPVTLSVSGNPPGTIVRFGQNPVTPGGGTRIGVVGTANGTPGDYNMQVSGAAGTLERSAQVTLSLSTAAPAPFVLTAPANGAVEVARRPEFVWEASAQATSYLVEVSTDAGFTSIVYSASTDETMLRADTALDSLTEYFWRVSPTNICGDGPVSVVASFTTEDTPDILLVDDDDNSPDSRDSYTSLLDAMGLSFDVWDTNDSDNEPDASELSAYEQVIWFTGDSFGGTAGPGAAGETALASFLDSGGKCLMMTSQDYFFDRGLTPFMTDYLGAADLTSDINQTNVTGGFAFAQLGPYSLNYPFTNFSDRMVPAQSAGGLPAFNGDQGLAATSKRTVGFFGAFLGFPIEAIATEAERIEVMERFLLLCPPTE